MCVHILARLCLPVVSVLLSCSTSGAAIETAQTFTGIEGEQQPPVLVLALLGMALFMAITAAFLVNAVRRRRIERRLIASESQYRLLAEHATDMISKHELDGTYVYISPACHRLLGYAPEELVGRDAYAFFHPEDRVAIEQSHQTILKGTMVYTVSYRIRHRDGHYVWVETTSRTVRQPETGEVEEIIAITRDITERKQIEEALQGSKEELNLTLQATTEGIWTWDFRTNVLSFSPRYYTMLGYEPGEFPASFESWHDLIHPDDLEHAQEVAHRWLQKKSGRYDNEFRLRTKAGAYRWIHARGTVVEWDENGQAVRMIGNHEDITERKRAEDALRESESRVRHKLESVLSPDGDLGALELAEIVDVEAIQALMDDFYALTNIGIAIVDLQGEVLVATGWQDICTQFHRVHPETCQHCVESDTVLSSGVEPGTYKRYKCKNQMWDMATPIVVGERHVGNLFLGQFFFEDELVDRELFREQAQTYGFDEAAYLAALDRVPRWSREKVETVFSFYMQLAAMISQLSHSNLKLARALAERERLLAARKESEQTFRSYIENAPYGIFVADQDGHYVDMNPEACRLTGYSRDELLGLRINDLTPPGHHEMAAAHFRAVVEEGFATGEVLLITKDGSRRWCSVIAVRLSENRFLGYTADITERLQAEQALRESETSLREANAAKDRFFSIIAHDLKNPLLAVSSGTELLKEHLQNSADQFAREMSRELYHASHQLSKLLENLLAWSQMQRGKVPYKPRCVDVYVAVHTGINLLHENAVQKQIAVTCLVEEGTVVYADDDMLDAIVRNLLSNAIKFTPRGGEVSIEASARDGFVEIAIVDDGVGMSANKISRLFQLGERNISSAGTAGEKGTGLGLILCRDFVERHGGEIWAESQLGEGSRVTFTLPRADLA